MSGQPESKFEAIYILQLFLIHLFVGDPSRTSSHNTNKGGAIVFDLPCLLVIPRALLPTTPTKAEEWNKLKTALEKNNQDINRYNQTFKEKNYPAVILEKKEQVINN